MIEYYRWPFNISLPVLYANRQWAVTKYGIECLTSDYAIERYRIAERCPNSSISMWVLHMGDKEWCDIREFAEVLQVGLEVHRVKGRSMIDISESVSEALKKRENGEKFDKFLNDIDAYKSQSKFKIISLGDLDAAYDLWNEHQRRTKAGL